MNFPELAIYSKGDGQKDYTAKYHYSEGGREYNKPEVACGMGCKKSCRGDGLLFFGPIQMSEEKKNELGVSSRLIALQ